MNIPKHVAIIMDGNGRWAQKRGRERTFGHIQGARVAKKIITESAQSGLEYLTLFAFSTENWFRPAAEVSFLMRLLKHQIIRERRNLMQNNIRFKIVGDLTQLPGPVAESVSETVEMTAKNTGMTLIFCLNYGGRQDLTSAMKKLAKCIQDGTITVGEINESMISQNLSTSGIPDPDFIIRTSGEFRISNFMLWQAAYSEIYITNILWPDFTTLDFQNALLEFSRRTRRFGRVLDQSKDVQL